MDNAWKDKLRERFSEYSVPEPEGLWEGIEQGLSGKKRNRLAPVWWTASGLAAAAVVALTVFLHPEKKITAPLSLPEPDLTVSVVPADTSSSAPSVLLADALPTTETTTTDKKSESTVNKVIKTIIEQEPEVTVPTTTQVFEPEIQPQEEPEKKPTEAIVTTTTVEPEPEPEPEHDEPVTVPEETPDPASRRSAVSIGVYGEGGQTTGANSQGIGMSGMDAYMTRSAGGQGTSDAGSIMRILTSNRASTFEAHHSAPLRTGITVGYGLTNHLSLVSGLTWTYLNSEFNFSEDAGPIGNLTTQELGYLGIPLRLEAGTNLWKGIWLHAGVGGMVEKGMMASSRTRTLLEGQQLEWKDNPTPDTGGLLWSVGASAGAEFRYGPVFGLYVSPGIEYHFDNGSPVRSAYTEKPLHWTVNIGLRFHLGK